MNLLASRKVSIVDDTAGTTRDRVSALVSLPAPDPSADPALAEFTDTGGYGVYTVEGRRIDDAGHDLAALTNDIERQIASAVESADLILLVIDAQVGVTPQDREVARLLREGGLGTRSGSKANASHPVMEHGGKVMVVANKVDGPRWEMHALEGANLGFGEPLMVSAKNNYRRREFVDAMHAIVEAMRTPVKKRRKKAEVTEDGINPPEKAGMSALVAGVRLAPDLMLAIVGKRNAGKSTLVNHLAGQERVIVSEIPGTTRDAVDVRFEMDGRTFVAIDTAGLRKKKSFQDRIEWYALDRLQIAVERCHVAMMLIDATVAVSQIDQQLGQMLVNSYKPVIIVVNKWDLAKDRFATLGGKRRAGTKISSGMYEEYLRAELKGLDFAPIAFTSGKTGQNIKETIDLAFDLLAQSRARVGTGALNRLMSTIVEKQGPTNKIGSFAKIFYASQITTAPPTIMCVVNKPDLFTPNYQRFLMNRFRQELPFPEVPIKLIIRGRKQDERFERDETSDTARGGKFGKGKTVSRRSLQNNPKPSHSSKMARGGEFFDE